MKPAVALLAYLSGMLSLLASDTTIDVGGTQLTIPAPDGFAPVTPEMAKLISQLDSFVTPVSQRFLWFLDERELQTAKTGGFPGLTRLFSVQCARKDIPTFFTIRDFAKLKKLVREQNAELIKKLERRMPGYLENVNKGIQKEFDWEGTLGVNGYIPVAG